MCKKTYFRLLSFFMTLILCFSSALTAFAEESAQLSTEILTEQDENIVNYDIKSPITYADFVKMASKLFHYDKQPKIQSGKITLQAWFAENISTLATEKPDETLTRQDAAVMIAKMLKCNLTNSEKTKFKDDGQIEDYAKDCINALTAKGYLNGYADKTFRPQNPITFGEATNLLNTVSGTVYEKAGIYDQNGQTIKGNLSIVSPGVELNNAVIEGDLYISEGVGTGEVTLNHVTVKGETIVSGGGMNSILFVDTQLGSLRVEVPDNTPVRVVASGSTKINMTEVRSETKLQTDTLTGDGFQGIVIAIPSIARVSLEGNFPSVIVDSPNAKVDILGGKTENIVITEKAVEAKVNLSSTTNVSSMQINAQATVGGTGNLESVSITSQNVSIAQNPTIVDVADNVTTTVNNNTFKPGVHNTNKGSNSSHSSSNQQNTSSNGPLTLNGPENVTVYAGEKAVFKANAKASSRLYYQWYRNNVEIKGATSDSYSFITALSDNGSKFTVKVWTGGPNTVIETASKTAVLTVQSKALKPKEKVLLAKGSEGTAGNASITGLEIGQRYYIIQYKDNQSYAVRKDGTLGAALTGEILYDNLESIETDTIINLVNRETYKVVKVLEKEKEALDYSYVELSQAADSIFVDMIFEEPIEFFVNGKNPSTLDDVFMYHSGSLNAAINKVILSDDKKGIKFILPKKGDSNDYQISLNQKTKEENWRLKNIGVDNEYKAMKGIFLSFTMDDLSNPPFTVNGPNNVSVTAGKKAVFQADAEPASGLHYQWYRNDNAISGATTDSYSFTPGLSDNGTKFSVKVWAEKPGRVREPVFSKTAVLTVKSKPSYVILKKDSEGTAGDACITGLEKGQRYYIIQYKDNQSYAVRKDGTLGAALTGEILYDDLESLETDTIINLVNRETYKVVKVLKKEKEALDYSYVELSQGANSIFVDMIFEKPIEFFVNGKNPSTLNDVFMYHSGSLNAAINEVILSDDKKGIQFFLPKKGNSNDYQISLNEKAKEENWRLKNVDADNEYKAMKGIFLSFTVDDLSNPSFTVKGPNDVSVTAGEKAVFRADAEPASGLYYQWYRDGKEISGATADSYSFIPGLSDNGAKFSVKVWSEKPGRVREPVFSKTAFLTVEPENKLVILEEGSEGTAGDACITDLEEGQCYYIISYKDNKSYAVKADGTLGAEGTTFDYDDLEPLKVTTIPNLINGEKYKVVKVEPKSLTVILEEGSEGTAGNESVTDLKEGQRYYIISYKDGKSYAVKADGTLGAEGTTFAYEDLVSLETTTITGLTNLERYKVVKVEEPKGPPLTVILEEGSEGIAGNACITGLEEGQRYYIISYKDGKSYSYPVMKNGTLGPETTETIYDNIEPLETTTITGLINEEKYNVVKVLPDTPVLQSLNILGLTNTLDFLGYVPKAIDGQASVSTTQFSLKMESNKEDAVITVSYKLANGEEQTITLADDNSCRIPLNYVTNAQVTITVASKDDAENKSLYKLNVTRSADIIVTRSPSSTSNVVGTMSLNSASSIYFYIKYMKPTETLEGIECKKNDASIAFQKGNHYTETLRSDGTIYIALTEAFAKTIKGGDTLEFTFNFDSETVSQKVCTVSIRKTTPTPPPYVPSYNIKFGEPELISGDYWLNVFVPVTKDTGKPVDNEIGNIIYCAELATYYGDDSYSKSSFYSPTIYEHEGQKGILMSISIPIMSAALDKSKKAVPNKYKVSIDYKLASGSKDTFVSSIKDIPEGAALQGKVEFYKTDDSSHKIIPTANGEDEYTLTLTTADTPFSYEYKQEQQQEKEFSVCTNLVNAIVKNDNGQTLYLVSNENPELVYMAARMNSVPKLFFYDYKGDATLTGDFVTSQYFSIQYSGDLGYQFVFSYVTGNSSFYPTTEEQLKGKYLDPENIHLKIGKKEDGTVIEKTMKELLGLDSRNSVRNLYFDSVKELIAAFGINPLEDTINYTVVSSAELSGDFSKFTLSDVSDSFYSNSGALTEIIIKDKNSDASMKVNPTETQDIQDIVIPYKDAAILTKSTANYECVVYDEDAVPVDGKGLILSEGVSTPIAIVVSSAGRCPKVYKFNITYKPQDDAPPAKAKMRMLASRSQEVYVPFIQLTDDMTEEEIAEILKSLENESVEENTSKPSDENTSKPSDEDTSKPSDEDTSKPSDEDTSKPSDKDTSKPSDEDTSKPSDEDTSKPSNEDTSKPSDEDTSKPSDEDTSRPSDEDTSKPSDEDTSKPSDEDTSKPSDEDTSKPSDEDTSKPSDEDTSKPSNEDTNKPSDEDTSKPSDEDTSKPSDEDTSKPSDEDTSEPSDEDTSKPSDEDTSKPSDEDTSKPSDEDTSESSDEDTSESSDEDTIESSDEDTSESSDEDTSSDSSDEDTIE